MALALVVFASSVVPVRQAQAVVPLVGLAVAALGPGGTIVTADLLTAGVTSLIGGSIVALALTPSTADAPMRVPLMSDQPTIDAVMPPPTAPATVSPTTSYMYCGGSLSLSACIAQSVSICTQNAQSGYPTGTCTAGSPSCSGGGSSCSVSIHISYVNGSSYDYQVSMTGSSAVTCPAGSTSNGSQCVVTNPRQIQPDSKADVARTSAGFNYSAEADALPSYAAVSGGKVYAQGKNSAGQPVMIEYAVSPDGTKTYITHYTQSEDATQTTVRTQAITVDSATGAVTGATTGTAVGSINPATQAGAVPSVTTGAAVTSGSGTSSEPLVLPTDYARTGEAANAATSINSKLETLHKDLTEKGADVADPVSPQASAFSDAFFKGTFGNLLAWQLPSHTSTCPTITFDYMMFSSHQVHTMDAQCTISEQIRPVLNVVMIVCWTIVALFVLLEA